jgi:hypothetical protein
MGLHKAAMVQTVTSHYAQWYYGYTGITFLIGAFLVYGSVRTRWPK